MVVGTCTGKCEGKIKLTAGWLDDEVLVVVDVVVVVVVVVVGEEARVG